MRAVSRKKSEMTGKDICRYVGVDCVLVILLIVEELHARVEYNDKN